MGTLKRDAKRVLSHLHLQEDGSVITDAPCTIEIPVRFTERNLAVLGSDVFTIGFFPIIFNGEYYGVNNTIGMVQIVPSSTEKVIRGGKDEYYAFSFQRGDVLFKSVDIVVNDTLTYYLYNEFVSMGNIPWYMNYYDTANMFETAFEHAGVTLGARSILELIISTITRDSTDLTRLYRHILSSHEDIWTKPPVTVPFKSVIWNTADTVSKLNGANFNDGITSAVVNPSENVELIEELLRT
jgi:hypothetical protein